MTIQTTRWRPDTCMCEIDYTWDDSVSQEERVHAMKTVIRCQHHVQHPHQKAYDEVLAENQSKNFAIGHLIENHPELKEKATGIRWRVNADRSIVIELPDEVKQNKKELNDGIKDKFAKEVTFE